MIERRLRGELETLLAEYPAVMVIGPRQAGKTTLVRHELPDFAYVNLESPDTRAFAIEDPRAFLAEQGEPVILDEIQRAPELLSYLQERVDAERGHGRFVITGSHQLELRAAVTQSLAGRTALLTLYPLSIAELATAGIAWEHFDEYLLHGFLPRIHDAPQRPTPAYANYLQTYVERDVRQLIRLKDVALFEKFLMLLAGRVGQLVNYRSLGNDVGVDDKTVKEWLSVLEASFVVFRLQPYFENFGKRAVKSPKVYFTEPGLLTYLLGLERTDQIRRDPLVGGMFENLAVVEALKSRTHRGLAPELYYFRDNNGREMDLLHRNGRELVDPFDALGADPRPPARTRRRVARRGRTLTERAKRAAHPIAPWSVLTTVAGAGRRRRPRSRAPALPRASDRRGCSRSRIWPGRPTDPDRP